MLRGPRGSLANRVLASSPGHGVYPLALWEETSQNGFSRSEARVAPCFGLAPTPVDAEARAHYVRVYPLGWIDNDLHRWTVRSEANCDLYSHCVPPFYRAVFTALRGLYLTPKSSILVQSQLLPHRWRWNRRFRFASHSRSQRSFRIDQIRYRSQACQSVEIVLFHSCGNGPANGKPLEENVFRPRCRTCVSRLSIRRRRFLQLGINPLQDFVHVNEQVLGGASRDASCLQRVSNLGRHKRYGCFAENLTDVVSKSGGLKIRRDVTVHEIQPVKDLIQPNQFPLILFQFLVQPLLLKRDLLLTLKQISLAALGVILGFAVIHRIHTLEVTQHV